MLSSSLYGNLCQDYHMSFSESHSAGGNITAINLTEGQLCLVPERTPSFLRKKMSEQGLIYIIFKGNSYLLLDF